MLKVGFARLDITPPLGEDLAGYYHRRSADGVLDSLYVNAIAISNDTDTLLMLAVDVIAFATARSNKIREGISARTGIAVDHIYISALHQHTAPWLTIAEEAKGAQFRDPIFDDVLNRKFADVAQMALDDRCEATMSTAAREVAEPIAFVRRYFTDQGVKCNPNTDKYTLTGRCAEADNTMRLVRFTREGANDVAIVNFSTHPDVIGGNKWSADWPGFTRRFVEADLAGVSCIFFTGCQGDSNHIDFFKPKEERLKGSTTGKGYEHSRYMGRIVADAVVAAWNETTPAVGEEIIAENRIVYNQTNLEGVEYYEEAVAWDNQYREREKNEGVRENIPHPYIESVAHARRLISLHSAPLFQTIPMAVAGVGNVLFIGFGGEPFTSYGKIVRDLVPDKFAVCSVCTNGYGGYFPTAEAFAQGGYEVISSLLTPTVEEELITALKDMLNK